MVATSVKVYGQEKPPRPITVTVNMSQSLSFGTFYHIGPGSVIIDPYGVRSKTGGVVLLSSGTFPSTALFDVVGNPGTVVSIINGADATLSGGGGSMILQTGASYPVSPFIITTTPTQVMIGGTLIVGNTGANPPGSYSGSFEVIFIQE